MKYEKTLEYSLFLVLFLLITAILLVNYPNFADKRYSHFKDKEGKTSENSNYSANASEQNITNETQEIFNIDYECLNDSHCNETAICVNHSCKGLNCTYPLYTSNHKCIGNKCTNDSDCTSSQICYFPFKECIKLECGLEEYAENHVCKKYECSKDIDCGLGAECFYHKCLRQVNYMYFETSEIGNTRTNGKRILNYDLLSNWDIGLFIAQTQTELDDLNNTIINLNNTVIDFSNNIALLVVEHGLKPTDVKFNKIMQVGSTVYIKLIVDDNKTGVGDDAWHLITLKRENFTEKSNLEFRITPTGKMIIGGEQMLSGISINYPADEKGNQYINPCVNETVYEGETKEITLLGKNYIIEVKSIELSNYGEGYKEYVFISIDGGTITGIEEGGTIKIDSLSIYVPYIYWNAKEGMGMYATFGICYEG